MKVKVNVTEEDIANGEPGDPCLCPVALAIARAIPDSSPWVDGADVDFGQEAHYASVPLPPEAKAWIFRLDTTGELGEPFEFRLELPAGTRSAGTS